MGLSVTTTIFLFVICLCGGIAIGAIFSRAKKTHAPPPPAAEEEEKEPQKEAVPAQPVLARAGDQELLRAWKDLSGNVWIEMDGQRLENRHSMQPEQKKRLLNLVLELRPWLNVPPASPTPPASPRQPAQVSPALGGRATARPASKPVETTRPQVNFKSIVEQIDDVLQKKLAGSIFAEQDIHLLDGPGGTVLAKVGLETYEGVEAVKDPEIRGLIKLAVAEWEKGAK